MYIFFLFQDIDECSQTSGICSNGVCENMMGAYQCICDEGYKQAGSATSCVDVDECAEANGGCDDLCINSPGSFSCACNSGFMLLMDGKQCKDIGKRHALKKYDQFTLNTSCFCGSTTINLFILFLMQKFREIA